MADGIAVGIANDRPHGLRASMYWIVSIALIWLFHAFIADQIDGYYFSVIMYTGINMILAVSLNLVNGFTGQFSMGHAGFMSVGAYASAFMTTTLAARNPELIQGPLGSLAFLASLALGGSLAALVGYVVGLPSLRLRGDYLAIVTLGAGEIIRVVFLNIEAVGGARGMAGIPQLASFGWLYTMVVVTVFTVWRIVHSAQGRAFLAVREDEIAAESMGVHTTRAKVRAFVIGAFFAGVAGGLFAHQLGYLNPQPFDYNRSFEVIIMVVLGGMGSVTGSVIAAAILTIIREALRELKDSGFTQYDYRMIIYSLFLIGLMLTRPNGLFGFKEFVDFLPDRFRKRFTYKDRVVA